MSAPARRLWHYARPYAGLFVLAFVSSVILNVANLIRPYLVKILTDEVLTGRTLDGKTPLLLEILAALLVATIVKGIFTWTQGISLTNASERTVRDLREDVYAHLLRLPIAWFDRQRRGDLLVRFTDDLRALANCMTSGLMGMLNETLVLLVSLVYMLAKDWQLTILAMVVTPLAGFVVKRFSKRVSQATTEAQEHLSDLSSVVEETVSGIKVVKAFHKEAEESDRFARHNESSFRAAMRIVQLTATQSPIVEILATAGIAVVLWYCALNIITGRLSLGDLLAFWAFMLLANTPVHRLPNTVAMLGRGRVALARLMEIRDEAPEVDAGTEVLECPQGGIELEDVRFRYTADRDEALKGVTLRIQPGEHVALLGPNGAGKSTLVNLLPRFYEPAQGSIRLDGRDLRHLRLGSLRRAVGVVPQETFLFSGTIADNIAFGRPDAGRDEIEQAAKSAGAHDFIAALDQGYDTPLGEKGVGLSGGQRQRVAIARMLLEDPRLVILDEATSNLDPDAERALADSLEAVTRGRTVIQIAHRPGAARGADRVIVLEDGRVAEEGTHESLVARKGVFWRLQQAMEGASAT